MKRKKPEPGPAPAKMNIPEPVWCFYCKLTHRISALILFCAVELVFSQIKNPGYTANLNPADSVRLLLPYHQPYVNLSTPGTHLNFQLSQPAQIRPRYYDPRNVMPENRLFLDYRGTSYYVPRQINNRLAQIMNRPSPDSFLPVLAVGVLAAKLALQYVKIEHKIEITATDYLTDARAFPVLAALWRSSPQTARQLFERDELKQQYTFSQFLTFLNELAEGKLVLRKREEAGETLYFCAQSAAQARTVLNQDPQVVSFDSLHKNRLYRLLTIIDAL